MSVISTAREHKLMGATTMARIPLYHAASARPVPRGRFWPWLPRLLGVLAGVSLLGAGLGHGQRSTLPGVDGTLALSASGAGAAASLIVRDEQSVMIRNPSTARARPPTATSDTATTPKLLLIGSDGEAITLPAPGGIGAGGGTLSQATLSWRTGS